jgi:hypothetical protein
MAEFGQMPTRQIPDRGRPACEAGSHLELAEAMFLSLPSHSIEASADRLSLGSDLHDGYRFCRCLEEVQI